MKVYFCFQAGCKKIKEEDGDKWIESKTNLTVLAKIEGIVLEPEYCEEHGAVLDGIAQANRFRNQVESLKET